MKADFEKGTKVCSKCKRELPIEMFGKRKSESDGLQYYCKECKKNMQKNMHMYLMEKKNSTNRHIQVLERLL